MVNSQLAQLVEDELPRSATSTPPSLLGVAGLSKARILHDSGSGYNSATFEEKESQLELGKFHQLVLNNFETNNSNG
jgi:hypothetical protein